ncbi:MAG TPA: peptidoglycan recognition family protein [Thermoleophilia bacterium]
MRIRTISLIALAVAAVIAAIAIIAAPAFAATSAPKPPIVKNYIAYGADRKAQMADYSLHHYGRHTYLLTDPKAIVLHHTDGADWQSAWNTFDANTAYQTAAGKEKPGVSAQFIIDKDGTIYQLMPLTYRARHCIGMNWKSFGIEFVQESVAGHSGRWMDRQILARTRQANAGVKLVRYLQARFGIKTTDVVGHATANGSRFFKDLTGIKNGAGDWFAPEVQVFRSRL